MIVEDQLDRRVGRIVGVEKLEEFDELTTAKAVDDQRMDVAGDKVDMDSGVARQIWGGRRDRLDTRLLVRDDRNRLARPFLLHRRRILQESHLTINAQHLGHLLGKVGIALCPQGISEVFAFRHASATSRALAFSVIVGSRPGARAIVERRHWALGHGSFDAALDRLMMQSERPRYRKKRRGLPIGQQYPRPLDPASRLGSRLRDRSQLRRIRISERQFNRPPPRCHDLIPHHLTAERKL
jgi:hypothetical protein